MDAEQRHALKTNELGEVLMKAREWGEKWLNHVLIAITAIALLYTGYKVWTWRAESSLATAWSEFAKINIDDATAGDAPLDQLRSVISSTSDPSLNAMARIRLAEGLVDRAAKGDAAARLTAAASELRSVIDASGTPNPLKAAALFQLATVQESQRDFNAARETYKTIQTDSRFEGSPFRAMSDERMKNIDEIAKPITFTPGSPPPPPPPPTNEPATPESQPAATAPAEAPAAAPASAPAEPETPAAEEPKADQPPT